jgi:aerobic carbon-monoxide dehydrogenase small subunit
MASASDQGGITQSSPGLFDISLIVNGAPQAVRVPARRLLSDCLRHDLRLTGTHVGCEHGVCGACTVLVDGVAVRSCLMLAVTADGTRITTVEGLTEPDGTLSAVQQAFADCHGLQCGFCTPGFLTTITAGLAENPDPSPDQAREIIGGNLCRCTGYQNIVRAVLRAAVLMRETGQKREAGQ